MWNFKLPTAIKFGVNAAADIRPDIDAFGRKCVLVSDPFLVKLPPIQAIIESLEPAAVFTGVKPNPTVGNVDELAALLRETGAEAVVAIGGGSAMDCAKAASCLAKTSDASIRPYHTGGRAFDRAHGALPLVTLPTTAGTGAEITPIAVLDDEEKSVKRPMASDLFYPALAVVDPALTLSLPLRLTAMTALDALSHAIEGYWSCNHQPICDILAKEAGKKIFENLPKVFDDLQNLEARTELSYAALIAGIAFHLPKNAIMHACSFVLSSRYQLPHGAACAFTMEEAIRFNAPAMAGRMEEFAGYCGFENVEAMTAAVTVLKKRGLLPATFADAKIPAGELELIVKESFHPLMNNNPRRVTEEALRELYRKLL